MDFRVQYFIIYVLYVQLFRNKKSVGGGQLDNSSQWCVRTILGLIMMICIFLEYILTIDGVGERDMYSLLFYKEFTGPKIMDPEIVFTRTNRSY